LVKVILNIYDGKKAEFRDLFKKIEMSVFFDYFWALIKYFLIVFSGLILFVVPGIIWGIKYSMYQYLFIDKKMTSKDVFKKSAEITDGYKWDLFLFNLITFLLAILGIICFYVGLLVVTPVIILANIYIYRRLLGEK
jgi:uncharacterized membrane protein